MNSVKQINRIEPRWPPVEGYPGWILPVQNENGITRGLSCEDLGKLDAYEREIACASDKAYTPGITSHVQPSNVPIARMSIEGKTVAFMMGHHACPRQCDQNFIVEPTYEVYRGVTMIIYPNNTVSVIDIKNGGLQSFESREALEESDYFLNTVASLDPRNVDSNMDKELESMRDVRKTFSDLNTKERSSVFDKMWENGSPIEGDIATVATVVSDAFKNDCSAESTWAMNQTLPGLEKQPTELTIATDCNVKRYAKKIDMY